MQAIIYARVSTSAQEREGTSLDSQLASLKAYAKKQKYSVLKTISESHTGSDLWDRPGMNQARELIRAHKAQVLVCYAIDRLSRNPAHLIILLEEAERHGARIEFVTERMEDSPEWRLIQYVKSYAAELEREKIRERSVRGKKQRALSGKLHRSSTELYGYVRNHDANRREIVEHEARHVRRIFDFVLAGHSLNSIANTLNTEGIPPPSAGKRTFQDGRLAIWNPSTIERIIRETSYCGRPVAWRWQAATKKNGNQVVRPIAEHISLPSEVCPPILPPDTWDAAQRALSANTGTLTRNMERFSLLRGMIFCATCGRTLVPDNGGYRCSSRKLIATNCGNGNVNRKIEAWVWESIEKILYDSEPFSERIAEVQAKRETDDRVSASQIAEAQNRLAALERGEQRILRIIAGTDDPRLIRNAELQLKQLATDRLKIDTDLQLLESSKLDSSLQASQIEELIERTLKSSERPTTPEGKREILKLLGVKVLADKSEWKLSIVSSVQGLHPEDVGNVVGVPAFVIASRAA